MDRVDGGDDGGGRDKGRNIPTYFLQLLIFLFLLTFLLFLFFFLFFIFYLFFKHFRRLE